ncbi:putative cobalamin synthesis protein [Kockovaella imperatae]|uniref:Putative cobalamin synthesis protein n=1 Tax=Kockovaella imperatae TaxID=4999 RepID=A0A1Y1UCU0_9TREE|nr:putative cobalamin synthesis protein [Kockovaella imperatae]ORX35860.1 putative cobalamin synthesis protein [Kockovaella imperatae]
MSPVATDIAKDTRLPVTLLSGFLGSGKTTLLSNILKSKDHGLKCAVIVNDMGALNIDAALVKNHKLTRTDEKVVQMQNGCICCTLRADLLEEVATLAEQGAFDYLLIESSGISEPIQVAETFTTEFAESIDPTTSVQEIAEALVDDKEPDATPESKMKLAKLIADGGLSKVARLDTCVSVVDCTTFFGDFDTTDFLTDRHEDVDPEDERNITDLLTDQIEFANVILLNKTDAVPSKEVNNVEALVRKLNPDARIFRTQYSSVPLQEILNTGTFDFAKASFSAGWLQSLRDASEYVEKDGKKMMIPKPETEEYGISSFVFSARRPFHPKRLWEVLEDSFCILQGSPDEDDEDEDEDEDEIGGDADAEESHEDGDIEIDGDKDGPSVKDTKAQVRARLLEEKAKMNLPAKVESKRKSPLWKGVLRSKGFVWMATRPSVHGEWSQAGVMFTLTGGGPWMCEVPEDEWPTDSDEIKEQIRSDFEGEWGDRRQEIVFIGQSIDQTALVKALNDALLDDSEWRMWERTMKSRRPMEKKLERLYDLFDDGWEDWPDMAEDDDEHGHDHSHHVAKRQKSE